MIKRMWHTVGQHYLVFRVIGPVGYFLSLFEPREVQVKRDWKRSGNQVHSMFSLSYASYFTVPRIVLQGMPVWWQAMFVWLMKFVPATPEYAVQRRDSKGRFITDPFANYRRGDVEELMKEYNDENRSLQSKN